MKCTMWGHFFQVASWLFRIMWCSFTTCLLFKTKANHGFFVCHRTVSMAAVYQLKIKYDQDKFRVFFQTQNAQWALNLLKINTLWLNITKKSRRYTSSHGTFQCTMCLIWNKARSIKNVTLKVAEKFVGVAVYWEE